MAHMDQAAIDAFLQDDRHAILATNRSTGAPQLTPVWFLYEDGRLYVSAQADTVKVGNLRKDPNISLCIDGGRDDVRYVAVSGTAELVEPEAPQQQEMRRRIIAKYHPTEEAAARYFERVKHSPAVLIVITPQNWIAEDLR